MFGDSTTLHDSQAVAHTHTLIQRMMGTTVNLANTGRRKFLQVPSTFASADQGQSTAESQPGASRVDKICTGAGIVTESDQAAFGSNPTGSKAGVTGTTEAATHEDGAVCVRKQRTQEHTTTATRADGVQRTARVIRGASPEPAICDSHRADSVSGDDTTQCFVIIPSGLKL